jgi:hypothetical protein
MWNQSHPTSRNLGWARYEHGTPRVRSTSVVFDTITSSTLSRRGWECMRNSWPPVRWPSTGQPFWWLSYGTAASSHCPSLTEISGITFQVTWRLFHFRGALSSPPPPSGSQDLGHFRCPFGLTSRISPDHTFGITIPFLLPSLSNLRPFYFHVVHKHDYGHMSRKIGLLLHQTEAAILFNMTFAWISSVLSPFCTLFFNHWAVYI